MKSSLFLLFVAVLSAIQVQSVIVAGQPLFNSFEDRPLFKGHTLFNDADDGVIIIAALRRPGATFRGKYKKVIETTTRKIVKTTTTTTTEASTTTTEAIAPTTEKTTQEPVDVVKYYVNTRRDLLVRQDRQNPLWTARKRVTRPPTYVQKKKAVKVNVVDEEEAYSVRRARYLFTQRQGRK